MACAYFTLRFSSAQFKSYMDALAVIVKRSKILYVIQSPNCYQRRHFMYINALMVFQSQDEVQWVGAVVVAFGGSQQH